MAVSSKTIPILLMEDGVMDSYRMLSALALLLIGGPLLAQDTKPEAVQTFSGRQHTVSPLALTVDAKAKLTQIHTLLGHNSRVRCASPHSSTRGRRMGGGA